MLNTREVLSQLVAKPYEPFTTIQLRQEIARELVAAPEKDPCVVTISFLNTKLLHLIEAINLPLLNQVLTAIKQKCLTPSFAEMQLTLSSNPTPEEASEFCSRIHTELQQIQAHREELAHYISFFTQAKGYVVSFASAAEILLKDVPKEHKTSKDSILNDLDTYSKYLSNQVKDLNHILESVFGPRTNLGLRLESSLRLLERFRDPSQRGFTIT